MKKLIFRIILVPAILIVEAINWVFILADEIFFPAYKKNKVNSPLFITGLPRTGSTFMHNLINQDKAGFTTMKLWEIVFAPSVIQKRILISLKKIDARINQPLIRFLKAFEKLLLKEFDDFHPLSLFIIEEDEYILIHNFSSAFMLFFFPAFKFAFNSNLNIEKYRPSKKHTLKFYEKCVKKHLFVFGPEKTYLAKSPAHILRYEALKETFPDLRLIYMLRAPHRSIPSTMSLFDHFNKIFYSKLSIQEINTYTLLMADQSFETLNHLNTPANGELFSVIKFEEFVKNPATTVLTAYQNFSYEISDDFKARLQAFSQQHPKYISKHKYSAEKYALSFKQLYDSYQNIYEKYYRSETFHDLN